jgi:hypothetical protein
MVPHPGRESSKKAAPLLAPLFKTAHMHQAGQRRRPLGSIYPIAVQLGISFRRRSRCGLHDRTFRLHALRSEPPQGDQQLTRQCHHHYLPHATACAADAFTKPSDLGRVRLVSLAEPSQLTIMVRRRALPALPIPCSRSTPPLLYGVAVSPA